MTRLIVSIVLTALLSGCAAIQGAQGDAASAKQVAAQQAANTQNSTGTSVNTQTVTSPAPTRTPGQAATTNAAKMMAPLTH